jgi:predicted site-specific integrase-resolvase
MPDNVPQLLTLLAVAKALCVSPHTVRSWVRQGKLRPVRLCRRLLFDPEDISCLVAQSKAGQRQECARGPVSAR